MKRYSDNIPRHIVIQIVFLAAASFLIGYNYGVMNGLIAWLVLFGLAPQREGQ